MSITFLQPTAFGLLILLFIPKIYQRFFTFKNVQLLVSSPSNGQKKPLLLYLSPIVEYLTYISLIIALARPVLMDNKKSIPNVNQSVLILIDLSLSMEKYKDNTHQALTFLTTNIEQSEIAWAGFASDCYLISPFTTDKNYLLSQIKSIDTKIIGTGKTALGDGILASMLYFKPQQLNKKVIVVTDGISNDGKTGYAQAKEVVSRRGIEVKVLDVGNITNNLKNVYKFPNDSLVLKTDFLRTKFTSSQTIKNNNNLIFNDLYLHFLTTALVLFIIQLFLIYTGVDNVWKE